MREICVADLTLISVANYGYAAGVAVFLPIWLLWAIYAFFEGLIPTQNVSVPGYFLGSLLGGGLIAPLILALSLMVGTILLRIFRSLAPALHLKNGMNVSNIFE